jgi:hypothetical protein
MLELKKSFMKRKQILKIKLKTLSIITCILITCGCERWISPGNLTIDEIEYTEIYSDKILDLPNGAYTPDNPDFDINNPETWTGNMAQYVKLNYTYSVTFQIRNSGGSIAYDTEIDLYCLFDNGDEEVETIYIGDVKPNKSIRKTTNVFCTNKQLIECNGEVFWFD